MHISLIDAPSDKYGALTGLSRPLVHTMNQASMNRSTHEALLALLHWAVERMEGHVTDDLAAHEAMVRGEPVIPAIAQESDENRPPESTQDASTAVAEGGSPTEAEKPAESARSATLADAVPLSLDMVADSEADSAAQAEIAAIEGTPAEAPAVVAPVKRVAKPK